MHALQIAVVTWVLALGLGMLSGRVLRAPAGYVLPAMLVLLFALAMGELLMTPIALLALLGSILGHRIRVAAGR